MKGVFKFLLVIVIMVTGKNSISLDMTNIERMSLRQRVLSCMVLGFEGTSPEDSNVTYTASLIKEGLGGVLPFAHNIENSDQFQNLMRFFAEQSPPDFPVLRTLDAEGGHVWRFNFKEGFPIIGPKGHFPDLFTEDKGWKVIKVDGSFIYFPTPPAASIAQLPEDEARDIYEKMAKCLWDHGINWDFAPVVDMNPVDHLCPVIGDLGRSYGNTPDQVVRYAGFMCDALRSKDMASCLKHYPGHGASEGDSHHQGFHNVGKGWTPAHQDIFHQLADKTDAIMTAHLFTDLGPTVPATLSKSVLDELRVHAPDKVIISDDLFMGGLRNIIDPKTGEKLTLERSTIMALAAGCDMVILSNNEAATGNPEFKRDPDFVEKIVTAVIGAIDAGELRMNTLNKAVFRSLELRSRLF